MNAPARRLYILITALFAVLAFATAWWSVARPESLRDNSENKRALLEQQRIHRGTIRASDGTVLARSVHGPGGTWTRRYSSADRDVSQPIGYSYTNLGQVGLEKSRNDALIGQTNGIESFVDQVLGKQQVGNDVTTTIDMAAQRVALEQLAGRRGSVVAIEPDTGKVRVMASVPGFDANDVRDPDAFRRLNRDPASPLFNRATQASYPPGSTFKVVTAAAALDSGQYTPDSVINGDSPKMVSGVPLANDDNVSYGDITLTTALTHSVNTVFAQIGEDLGKATMAKYMKRFGFDAKPPLDYPTDQMLASGEYDLKTGRLLPTTSPRVDVGRMAIGQDKLQVTPLQMATVAATVANGGVRVAPHLTEKIVDPDGRVVDRIRPHEEERVMCDQVGPRAGGDDAERGARGHRHGGGPGGHRRGRQDRDGADRSRSQHHAAVVHRLRTRQRSEDGHRGHRGAQRGRLRRHGGRADRQGGAGAAHGRGGQRRMIRDVPAGSLIDGRYRVAERVGSGGMADVYLAEDTQLGRDVAVKLLHRRFAEDHEFVERFRREASAAAGLSHPNVVGVFDRGEWDGTSYIAMEYLDRAHAASDLIVQEAAAGPGARDRHARSRSCAPRASPTSAA